LAFFLALFLAVIWPCLNPVKVNFFSDFSRCRLPVLGTPTYLTNFWNLVYNLDLGEALDFEVDFKRVGAPVSLSFVRFWCSFWPPFT
jgi:hypothetical protein